MYENFKILNKLGIYREIYAGQIFAFLWLPRKKRKLRETENAMEITKNGNDEIQSTDNKTNPTENVILTSTNPPPTKTN